MSLNISLYTVTACLILDNTGSRLYAKYYNRARGDQSSTLSQQLNFEKSIFSKVNKVNQDVILYDNNLVTYKQTNDVILMIVSSLDENESLIYSLINNMLESLNILLDNAVDKVTILEKYDLVSLAIDETIDDGIILEIEPAVIVSRVTNPPTFSSERNVHIDIDKGIFNALSFASKKIGERLQQGL